MLDTSYIRYPSFLSPQLLHGLEHGFLADVITFMRKNSRESTGLEHGFRTFEIAKIQRILDLLEQPLEVSWLDQQRKDFWIFQEEYMRRRGLSFTETFPKTAGLLEPWRPA